MPLRGIRSNTRWCQALYDVMGPLYPILRRLFPRYVTTRIVGREEGHRRGDFVFRPGSAKRRRGRCLRFEALNLLLAEARGLVARGDDGARRHHVDAYAAVLQLH